MARKLFDPGNPEGMTRNGVAVAVVLVALGLLWYANTRKPSTTAERK